MLFRCFLLVTFCIFNNAYFWDPFCSVGGWTCCRYPFLSHPDTAYQDLTENLMDNVFGQHIAVDVVLSTIRSHATEINPKKALALSFHGHTGTGKSFIAEQIVHSIYSEGTAKNFVKNYFGPHDFPEDTRPHVIREYKKRLREEVKATVNSCERSVFIFEEAHKIPKTVLDTLVPFLEPTGKDFEGINYRRAIFIFVSNVGAGTIDEITLNHWRAKKKRSDLTFHDFEKELQDEAYTSDEEAPGFWESRLLEKSLIDIFIPFLPLEKEHVKLCAEVEINRVGAAVTAEFIASKQTYWPDVEQMYSEEGCKHILALVKKYHTYQEDSQSWRKTEF